MIRWYRSETLGTGTRDDCYRSPLEEIIDITKLVDVGGMATQDWIWYQFVQCPQAEHDKIIADGRMLPITPLYAAKDEKVYMDDLDQCLLKEGMEQMEKDGIDLSWVKPETPPREVIGYLWRSLAADEWAKKNNESKETVMDILQANPILIRGEEY